MKQFISRVPREEDGFMPSFDPANTAEWVPFMAKNGFVIIKILTRMECEATVEEFLSDVNAHGDPSRKKQTITLDDPMTWEDCNWPVNGRHLVDYAPMTPLAFANRTHPNVHTVFSTLFQTSELYSHVDCWGVMRGTSQLPWKDSSGDVYYEEKPEWRTHLNPHWDVNPWAYVEELQQRKGDPTAHLYQSVLALVDCPDDVGGFSIAPGSAPNLHHWCSSVPKKQLSNPKHYTPPSTDPWCSQMQQVPLRAGELVVWDSGSLHCNFANHGPNLRIVQYLRCLPATTDPEDPLRGAYTPQNTARRWGVDYSQVEGLSDLAKQMLAVESPAT